MNTTVKMKTDMQQHKRTLEKGTRIGPDGMDALHVAPSGIKGGYVSFVVESPDGGVTLNRDEAERVIAAIKAAMDGGK